MSTCPYCHKEILVTATGKWICFNPSCIGYPAVIPQPKGK